MLWRSILRHAQVKCCCSPRNILTSIAATESSVWSISIIVPIAVIAGFACKLLYVSLPLPLPLPYYNCNVWLDKTFICMHILFIFLERYKHYVQISWIDVLNEWNCLEFCWNWSILSQLSMITNAFETYHTILWHLKVLEVGQNEWLNSVIIHSCNLFLIYGHASSSPFMSRILLPPPPKAFSARGILLSGVFLCEWVCASQKSCEHCISKTNERNFTQFWSRVCLGS